jgi:hypothetical protein
MVLGGTAIDAAELAQAIESQVLHENPLEFRSRLLIRDSLDVQIRRSELGPPGFSLLEHRVMETTKADAVLEFLRELGLHCAQPAKIEIGGAIALILAGMLSRRTEDIDIVDGVPASIRSQHEILQNLARRYGLHLTHFQSHFLPDKWADRLKSLGAFGKIQASLIDPIDIFVGKLFSPREKDRDDLRALSRVLDKKEIADRLAQNGKTLRAEYKLAHNASVNWYILYGENLPD